MDINDMILISVDDHVVEPPSMHEFFVDHLPAKYKERAPKVIRRDNGTDAWLIEGQEIATFGLNAVMGRDPTEWGYDPASFDQVRPGTYDVDQRVRDMDVNGVLAGMNFPSWPGNGGQFFVQNDDLEFVAAMIRAYNDWHIQAWCGAHPGRFIPLALSGFKLGPEWMAEEIRRVADLGCHVIPHAMPFQTAIFASELLWSPMMKKFPELKFALAEGAIGWYPYFLEKADFVYHHHHRWTGADFGGKLPSQVFKDRVLVCFIDDETGLEMRHRIGVENIAWECDYPHSDSTWPQAPEVLAKSLEAVQVPDDDIDKISWENAARFYGFDLFEHRSRAECTVG